MALKRKKIQRLPSASAPTNSVIDILPGKILVIDSKNHGTLVFDFSEFFFSARDDLVKNMCNALWSLRFEAEGISLQSYFNAFRNFWRFLSDQEKIGKEYRAISEIDRECIDRYLVWLDMQTVSPNHKNSGKKLSVSYKKTNYNGIKALIIAVYRIKGPDAAMLDFPKNPFPKSNSTGKRESYSEKEHRTIFNAINKDLRAIANGSKTVVPEQQTLAIYLLVLAMGTGANLQPLLELRRDSLRPHPMEDRELLFTAKRRGWTSFAVSSRRSNQQPPAVDASHTIPKSIGDYFRALAEFTNELSSGIDKELASFVFLWKIPRGPRKGETIRLTRIEAKTCLRGFSIRHKLLADNGQPLALSFGRLRPTYANQLYSRTNDIRKVSQALGHASVETTAKHYVGPSSETLRNQALTAESMVSAFTLLQDSGKSILAADGTLPDKEIKFLLKGGYSTGIAHCRNPFREEESVCKKFFTCFRCPNMLILEDDLWRLYSFYYRLLSERSKIRPDHWARTYGPIIKRIDEDIAPHFKINAVLEAKSKARSDPHPSWRSPTHDT